jgi:murein DD-endopeptidase MepM/ murein hydrolase activator NlpD
MPMTLSARHLFRLYPVLLLALTVAGGALLALGAEPDTVSVPLADGFESPVGKGGSGVYHRARGFTPNGHLGEDWNGAGGGDSDLGDPIQAVAHGVVVFARNYHVGWGNVVILRHAYYEDGEIKYVDSLYGHLLTFTVQEGQIVQRSQGIGTMGNNNGMYDAHLHFEMRKNLAIGMNRSAFARDFSNYYDPTKFIMAHRALANGGGQYAAVPINTFITTPAGGTAQPHLYAGPVTGAASRSSTLPPAKARPANTNNARGPFYIDRYSDLRGK